MKAYKFRLYPSAEQEKLLIKQLNMCRELYNAFLQQRIYAYRSGRHVGYNQQAMEMPGIKSALPEYRIVHSQVLQDVARRADRAYQNFFRRVMEKKAGKQIKAGFPRFKSAERYRSITYPQSGFEILENGHLSLSKIGRIRMFTHRQIEGQIKTLSIMRDGVGDWYASFSVIPAEQEHTAIQWPSEKCVGGDVGLLHLITLSDGTIIEPPKFLAKGEKSLIKAQRNLSKKKKGSNNREKAKKTLAKEHRKIKRQRDDYAHKASNKIVASGDIIALEDLDGAGMVKNHNLAKSIIDASWNTLVQHITYKAESAGKVVVLVDPRDTSKTCSSCDWVKEYMTLSDRIFLCDRCGLEIDRDLNASINIRNRGIAKIGRGTPEVTPVEIGALPERATPVVESGSPLH